MRTPSGPLWLRVLFVLGLALGLERLIVTDGEALEALARQAGAAALANDAAALEAVLAEDFQYGGKNREQAILEVQRLLRTYAPASVQVDLSQLQVHGDEAQALCAVQITGGQMGILRLTAEATFLRTQSGWRFLRVSLLQWRQ